LRTYERASILDIIDIYRANEIYLNLLEEYKMDQRAIELKCWLKSIDRNSKGIKKIVNIHFIGKLTTHKLTKKNIKVTNYKLTNDQCGLM
jgi:7-cyano-7-deazaguanine synthase in queuosine biosynthesis